MHKELLSPKSDFIFKLIFGDENNVDILTDFLQSVLKIPPEEYEKITLVDPHLRKTSADDKLSILDLRLQTKNRKEIEIDIQGLQCGGDERADHLLYREDDNGAVGRRRELRQDTASNSDSDNGF